MTGRLKSLTFDRDGKQIIAIKVNGDMRNQFDALNTFDIDIEIKKHREKRSLSANAYFHVLANKIAEATGISEEEAKAQLVCSYGTYSKDGDDKTVGIKLPVSVQPETVYPYVKFIETRVENGKEFNCYLLYKQTHLMDTAEMARLIDGAIYEAKELGIETDTPEQLAKYKTLWEKEE